MAKYKSGTYNKDSFCGGSNIDLKLLTFKDKIVIQSNLQSYVLQWNHTYLLHPGINRTEVMIRQYLYWPDIRNSIRKEITTCDTFQPTKRSNKNMVNYQLSYMRRCHGIDYV